MLVVKTTSPAISPSPAKLHPWKAAPSSRTSVALHRPCPPLRTCAKLCSSSVVYRLSTNYSTHDPALQRPSEIGGVGRAANECTTPYRPLLRKVDQREIRRRADGQAASATDPAAGAAAHRFDEAFQREPAAEDQLCVQRGEGRLVAEETGRGLLYWQLFLFRGVGSVVCRDEVEDAVAKGQPEACAVVLGPERGVDAVESVEGRDEIFCQSQVVGCGVGGDIGPVPEKPNEGGRKGRGDVGYMHLRPRLGGENEGRRRGGIFRAGRGAWDSGE